MALVMALVVDVVRSNVNITTSLLSPRWNGLEAFGDDLGWELSSNPDVPTGHVVVLGTHRMSRMNLAVLI